MNNEKIIAWAVMKDGECLAVRRFEPVASGEAEGVEFVPLVRFAEQPAQQEPGRNHWEDGDVFERIGAMKKHPAQRTWVGLTDGEIVDLCDGRLTTWGQVSTARAIEAKLREKNT